MKLIEFQHWLDVFTWWISQHIHHSCHIFFETISTNILNILFSDQIVGHLWNCTAWRDYWCTTTPSGPSQRPSFPSGHCSTLTSDTWYPDRYTLANQLHLFGIWIFLPFEKDGHHGWIWVKRLSMPQSMKHISLILTIKQSGDIFLFNKMIIYDYNT